MFLTDIAFFLGQILLAYMVVGLFFRSVGDSFIKNYNKWRIGEKKDGVQ